MTPFTCELSLGFEYGHVDRAAQFGTIETVATSHRLRMYAQQVSVDCGAGIGLGAESRKLRVFAIAARAAQQHLARQQRFTPYGDQTCRIKILRMESPQAHAVGWCGLFDLFRAIEGHGIVVQHVFCARLVKSIDDQQQIVIGVDSRSPG
jgi:hypothetical protein